VAPRFSAAAYIVVKTGSPRAAGFATLDKG